MIELTLGVALLAEETALEHILAASLGADRVIETPDIVWDTASYCRGSQHARESHGLNNALHFGVFQTIGS